jgi:hypothetical protein|tara:strand:- start:578 stop:1009 length:432 start_codon:yes stop_codon:yes gene_type:complete
MWHYNGKEFDETPEEYQGFVYQITEKATGMKYIGKKFFWKPKILPKTKARKRRVRTRAESDWRKYFGSSKEVQLLVEENGADAFHREILKLCKTKGQCSYYEMKYQLELDVLLKPEEYYNAFIGGKIHRKHILGLQSDETVVE